MVKKELALILYLLNTDYFFSPILQNRYTYTYIYKQNNVTRKDDTKSSNK